MKHGYDCHKNSYYTDSLNKWTAGGGNLPLGEFNITVKFKKPNGDFCKTVINIGRLEIVCFVADTKIHTTTGKKNIQDIKVGDIVYSMNMETMLIETTKVTETFKNEVKFETCLVYLGEESVECTTGHKFYEKQKGWTEAAKLENGDILIDTNGKEVTVTNVEIKKHDETIIVYNFEVEKNHNYFVGNIGILAHNLGTCGVWKE